MSIKKIFFILALGLFSSTVLAGGNHDHGHGHSHGPVDQASAEKIAAGKVANLANNGKIDKSWNTTKVDKAEQKQFGNQMEWVVSFKNDKVSDPEKQTLFVFLTLDGRYLAANYTGK